MWKHWKERGTKEKLSNYTGQNSGARKSQLSSPSPDAEAELNGEIVSLFENLIALWCHQIMMISYARFSFCDTMQELSDRGRHLYFLPQHLRCHINDSTATSYYCLHFRMWLNASLLLFSSRISNEHSPKLQIRSHSYLRAVSEVSINRSLDSLDPAGLLTSPKFRSRNESYMRAMSTISQVSTLATGH